MTVIGNNSANNSNSLATVNLVGSKGSNASAGLSSFLDIISMLSLPGEDLNSVSKAELLTSSLGSEGEPSTVQLLQKFLDQGQVSLLNEVSTNDISEETASQFLEFLSKKVTNGDVIPNLPTGKLNADISTNNNVLLRLALKEIREVALPVNINLFEDGSKGQSAPAISGELGDPLFIPKVPEIAQVLVNTSVMEDPEPKIVSIELGSIVESMPVGYDHAQITKVFTTSLNEAKGIISRLDLVVRGDSADIDFRVDEGLTIFESVEFDGERGMENKELYIELDKLKQNTLVVNLSIENLRSTDNFPQKVNLKFSEPKLPETKLVVNFSVQPEAKFFNADELNDLTHAAVISKSGESTGNLGLGLNSKIQIFRPKFEEELISRQSLNFVSANELNESFSDKLTAKLSSITSGEFENKQMLSSLRDAISKNEAISKLDENLHISKLDVSNIFKRSVKNRLMISTADVVSYRDAINPKEKPIFDFQWLSSIENEGITREKNMTNVKQGFREFGATVETLEAKSTASNFLEPNRLQAVSNPTDVTATKNIQNFGLNSMVNSLNLYDAQFSSRLGMLLADQIAKGSESFELQLEPESFGKVRVNVSLESSNVEVKMVAENSAAVMVLKGSENILQNIAEQNGLKLSDYSVDMQNNQNGENANKKDGSSKNQDNGPEVVKETDDENNNPSSENEYKLNLLA
ncbi:flagellar hook-length control protein FliK [Paracoccaceae bacterium]|nr:flagellar hook-length control protein FliK [Paracoccaceae bacterium]